VPPDCHVARAGGRVTEISRHRISHCTQSVRIPNNVKSVKMQYSFILKLVKSS
jgi:hypothetical protein